MLLISCRLETSFRLCSLANPVDSIFLLFNIRPQKANVCRSVCGRGFVRSAQTFSHFHAWLPLSDVCVCLSLLLSNFSAKNIKKTRGNSTTKGREWILMTWPARNKEKRGEKGFKTPLIFGRRSISGISAPVKGKKEREGMLNKGEKSHRGNYSAETKARK